MYARERSASKPAPLNDLMRAPTRAAELKESEVRSLASQRGPHVLSGEASIAESR